NRPAKGTNRRRSVFARLLDRFRIGPSRGFRGIGDGFQTNRQIQRYSQSCSSNAAVQSGTLPVIRNNVAAARQEPRAAAAVAELNSHGSVIGQPRGVHLIHWATAEEAGHFGPADIVHENLQRGLNAAWTGTGDVSEWTFLQLEFLEGSGCV